MNANEIVRALRMCAARHIESVPLEQRVADLIESLQAEITQLKDELADYNCDTKIGCKLIETVKAERDGQQPTKMFRAGITDGVHLDRLEEICNAEREGRCVVLPCKVDNEKLDEILKFCSNNG